MVDIDSGNPVFSTYYGGNQDDSITDMAIDPHGDIFITGSTSSSNFPVVNAQQTLIANPSDLSLKDVFISYMSPARRQIMWSTYLGSKASDYAKGIAIDEEGNIYVAGGVGELSSFSIYNSIPSSLLLQQTGVSKSGTFIAKYMHNGQALDYHSVAQFDYVQGVTALSLNSLNIPWIVGTSTCYSCYGWGSFIYSLQENPNAVDLILSTILSPVTAYVNNQVTYRIRIDNLGPKDAENIILWHTDIKGDSSNIYKYGELKVGQTLSRDFTFTFNYPQDFVFHIHVTSDNIDNDGSNNASILNTAIVYAPPYIYYIDPSYVPVGSKDITLKVYGAGIYEGSKILWNGKGRNISSNYISNSQINTQILSSEMSQAQEVNISVINPSPGGGLSNSVIMKIGQPSSSTTSSSTTLIRPSTSTTTSSSLTTTSTTIAGGAYNLYYPHVLNNAGTRTILTIVNSSNRLANITLKAYDSLGRLISGSGITNPASRQIAGGQQLVQESRQIFGNEFVTQAAWVEVVSDNPGLNGFYYFKDDAGLILDGEASISSGSSEMALPEVSNATYINIANPSNSASSVSLKVINKDGIVVALQVQILASKGCADLRMGDLFNPAILIDGNYISISSAYPIVAAEVLGAGTAYLTVVNALESSGGATQLYAPHYPFGGGLWQPYVSIINPTDGSTTATVQAFNDTGVQLGQNLTLTLPPRGKAFIADPGAFSLSSPATVVLAYLKVSSNARLLGSVRFSSPIPPVQQAMLPLTAGGSVSGIIPYWSQAGGVSSSLVSLNTGAAGQAATVAYNLHADDGRLVTTANRSLPAAGRDFLQLSGIVPAGTRGYATYTANPSAVVFGLISGQAMSSLMAVAAQGVPAVPTTTTSTSTSTTSTSSTSTTLPTVGTLRGYMDQPEANSTVSGVVTVTGWTAVVSGSLAGPVRRIELLVDGTLYSEIPGRIERPDVQAMMAAQGITAPINLGFAGTWDCRTVANGRHSLIIRAYDAANAFADVASIGLNVNNGGVVTTSTSTTSSTTSTTFVPLTGAVRGYLDAPTAGSTYGGVISVSGWSAVVAGSIAGPARRIELLSDGGLYTVITKRTERRDVQADLASQGIAAPAYLGFTALYDTWPLSNGRHTVAVRAYDATSTYSEIANITITVSNPVVTTSSTSTSSTTSTTISYPYRRIFPKAFLSDPNQSTGLAVLNLSTSPASLQFKAYSNAGAVLGSAQRTLQPKTQLAGVIGELISTLTGGTGWLSMESSVPDVEGFFLLYDNAVTTMDGTSVAGRVYREFVLPVAEGAEVSLVNPGNAPVDCRLAYVSSAGTESNAIQGTVPALGRMAIQADLIRPQGTTGGYLRGNCGGVVPLEVFGNVNWTAVLDATDATPGTGATTQYAPQFITSTDYQSTLDLINLEPAPNTLILTWLGDAGQVLGQPGTVTLPALGSSRLVGPAIFNTLGGALTEGYVKIQGGGRFAGAVRFTDPQQLAFGTALNLVATGQTDSYFSQIAQDAQYFTGLAAINPGARTAAVTVTVYDTTGRQVASGATQIVAGGRFSKLLPELVGTLPAMSKGYFQVRSTEPLVAFALFGTWNGSVLSAIPAQVATGR